MAEPGRGRGRHLLEALCNQQQQQQQQQSGPSGPRTQPPSARRPSTAAPAVRAGVPESMRVAEPSQPVPAITMAEPGNGRGLQLLQALRKQQQQQQQSGPSGPQTQPPSAWRPSTAAPAVRAGVPESMRVAEPSQPVPAITMAEPGNGRGLQLLQALRKQRQQQQQSGPSGPQTQPPSAWRPSTAAPAVRAGVPESMRVAEPSQPVPAITMAEPGKGRGLQLLQALRKQQQQQQQSGPSGPQTQPPSAWRPSTAAPAVRAGVPESMRVAEPSQPVPAITMAEPRKIRGLQLLQALRKQQQQQQQSGPSGPQTQPPSAWRPSTAAPAVRAGVPESMRVAEPSQPVPAITMAEPGKGRGLQLLQALRKQQQQQQQSGPSGPQTQPPSAWRPSTAAPAVRAGVPESMRVAEPSQPVPAITMAEPGNGRGLQLLQALRKQQQQQQQSGPSGPQTQPPSAWRPSTAAPAVRAGVPESMRVAEPSQPVPAITMAEPRKIRGLQLLQALRKQQQQQQQSGPSGPQTQPPSAWRPSTAAPAVRAGVPESMRVAEPSQPVPAITMAEPGNGRGLQLLQALRKQQQQQQQSGPSGPQTQPPSAWRPSTAAPAVRAGVPESMRVAEPSQPVPAITMAEPRKIRGLQLLQALRKQQQQQQQSGPSGPQTQPPSAWRPSTAAPAVRAGVPESMRVAEPSQPVPAITMAEPGNGRGLQLLQALRKQQQQQQQSGPSGPQTQPPSAWRPSTAAPAVRAGVPESMRVAEPSQPVPAITMAEPGKGRGLQLLQVLRKQQQQQQQQSGPSGPQAQPPSAWRPSTSAPAVRAGVPESMRVAEPSQPVPAITMAEPGRGRAEPSQPVPAITMAEPGRGRGRHLFEALRMLEQQQQQQQSTAAPAVRADVPKSMRVAEPSQPVPAITMAEPGRGRGRRLFEALRMLEQQQQQQQSTAAPAVRADVPKSMRVAKPSQPTAVSELAAVIILYEPRWVVSEELMVLGARPLYMIRTKKDIFEPSTTVGVKKNIIIEIPEEWCLYKYYVDCCPAKMNISACRGLLVSSRRLGGLLFNGKVLYTTKRLHPDPLILSSYRVKNYPPLMDFRFKLKRVVRPRDDHCEKVFGIVLGSFFHLLDMQLSARNYFSPSVKVIYLCTAQRMLNWYAVTKGSNYKKIFLEDIVGNYVITEYNKRKNRIVGISWQKSPRSTFQMRDANISFINYYRKKYNIVIRDPDQPLLISRAKRSDILWGMPKFEFLVPELCRLAFQNPHEPKPTKIKREPDQRIKRLLAFHERLMNSLRVAKVIKETGAWTRNICQQLVFLPNLTILQGNNHRYPAGTHGWDRAMRYNPLLKTAQLKSWVVITPWTHRHETDGFIDLIMRTAGFMAFTILKPEIIYIGDDRPKDYAKACERAIARIHPAIILCVLETDCAHRYGAIKKKCSVDHAVPSQIVCVCNMTRNISTTIARKVAIQMNCKLGGVPWSVEMPLQSILVIGYSACQDAFSRKLSFGGFVATLDCHSTRYFSKVNSYTSREEQSAHMADNVAAALRRYEELNNGLPERIFIYRGSVDDGQMPFVQNHEVTEIKKKLVEMYAELEYKMAYIVVSNRAPGTRSDTITGPNCYEFCLVFRYASAISPSTYYVIEDTTELHPDRMQVLSYRLTHLYFNSPKQVRFPAVYQYAHNLAHLSADTLHAEPHSALSDTLYFL